MESPEINSCTYEFLIFNEGCKNIKWRKDIFFTKWCWENWRTTQKRSKIEYFLTPHTINPKWIRDLKVRPEIITYLEENIGRTFFDINHCKICFDPLPKLMEIKTEINK